MGAELVRHGLDAVQNAVGEAFRALLEGKHLYQHVDVDVAGVVANMIKMRDGYGYADKQNVETSRSQALDVSERDRWFESRSSDKPKGYGEIVFRIPPVQMFCTRCKQRQPFNVEFVDDVLRFCTTQVDFSGFHPLSREAAEIRRRGAPVIQMFVIALLCQGCQSVPEVVIVRRSGVRLTLSGRAPIEQIEVPKFIPDAQVKYYRAARIAFNSNQVLAADSLLRIFVEQFVASVVERSTNERADDLLAKYAAKLPKDFTDRFPSLASVYSRLSGAIHSADETPELFEQARQDIDTHMDARRLYRL